MRLLRVDFRELTIFELFLPNQKAVKGSKNTGNEKEAKTRNII